MLDVVYKNGIVLPSVLIAWLKTIEIYKKKRDRYEQELET